MHSPKYILPNVKAPGWISINGSDWFKNVMHSENTKGNSWCLGGLRGRGDCHVASSASLSRFQVFVGSLRLPHANAAVAVTVFSQSFLHASLHTRRLHSHPKPSLPSLPPHENQTLDSTFGARCPLAHRVHNISLDGEAVVSQWRTSTTRSPSGTTTRGRSSCTTGPRSRRLRSRCRSLHSAYLAWSSGSAWRFTKSAVTAAMVRISLSLCFQASCVCERWVWVGLGFGLISLLFGLEGGGVGSIWFGCTCDRGAGWWRCMW